MDEVVEHCIHCGRLIRPTRQLSKWMTPWLHAWSADNHCDPNYNSPNLTRAEPDNQMRMT